jgi:aspergillopepsin I
MSPLHHLATGLLGLFALAQAAPTEKRNTGFSVTQIFKPRSTRPNVAAIYAHAYRNYNAKVPSHLASLAAGNDGSAVATPEENDFEYLTPVTIGGQTLNLDFDTGSSDLFVPPIYAVYLA